MTKQQFLEKYGQHNTAVHCRTRELSDEFLELCEKFDIRWRSGGKATNNSGYWEVYKEETCYELIWRCLGYNNRSCFKNRGFTIIEFETLKETKKPLVFEMLGIKPNEEFRYRIKHTNEISLNRFKFDINGSLLMNFGDYGWCKAKKMDVLVGLIYGICEIIKEQTPLLTEEEKEFLKAFRFDELEKHNVSLDLYFEGKLVHSISLLSFNLDFDGLELKKKYTSKELGL